jgi:DNA-binding transcriptional regulator YhcF (GntR family)
LKRAKIGDRCIDISNKTRIPFKTVRNLLFELEEKGIIKMVNRTRGKQITYISQVHKNLAEKALKKLIDDFQELATYFLEV